MINLVVRDLGALQNVLLIRQFYSSKLFVFLQLFSVLIQLLVLFIFNGLVDDLGGVFLAVDGVHGFYKNLNQAVHLVIVRDDEVNFTIFKLQRDALPCVESCLTIFDAGEAHVIHMFPIEPEPARKSAVDDADDFVQRRATS